MKLFKALLPVVLFLATVVGLYYYHYGRQDHYNPVAQNQQFYSRLNFALQQNQVKLASQITPKPHLDQVEFHVLDPDSKVVKVIFSSRTDPYLQTTSLQQIFKIATIKGKYAQLIDLSGSRPYATLKNN